MNKIEITEDRPLSYTAHDGAVVVVSVAGPVERVFTLTINGDRITSSRDESHVRTLARGWAEAHNARAAAPVQIESPLPAVERQSSGLAGGGAAANAMSAPVRDMLAVAAGARNGTIFRGAREHGDYTFTMMRAAIRRGWLDAGGTVMFRSARITPLGRKALARELASVGGAR
jgi:hypothetical protein